MYTKQTFGPVTYHKLQIGPVSLHYNNDQRDTYSAALEVGNVGLVLTRHNNGLRPYLFCHKLSTGELFRSAGLYVGRLHLYIKS